ncbi:MAG: DUF2027 domain-containing protein [Candidatus Amulumruptor sp.]
MAKIGDLVRFLNSVGGGRVTRIEGRIAYVDDDGFETPMLMNELVVVSPAESQIAKVAATQAEEAKPQPLPASVPSKPAPPVEVFETPTGDKINIVLGYEATDLKQLSTTTFDAYLVNDSNYYLSLCYMVSNDGKRWNLVTDTVIEPNTQALIDEISREKLSDMTYVAVQYTAYKKDKPFERKMPVWFEQKMDMTKFFKLHCFKENVYFEAPVIALEIVINDRQNQQLTINEDELKKAIAVKTKEDKPTQRPVKKFSHRKDTEALLEVDLHINELLDNTAGMSTSDILNYQIDTFRKVMDANLANHGRKIVFIHGKGEGVLRKAIEKELNYRYKKHRYQDASFKEYGFGATQVTIA